MNMATVQITKELVGDACNVVLGMMHKERNLVESPANNVRVFPNDPRIIGEMWKEAPELFGKLPINWLHQTDSIGLMLHWGPQEYPHQYSRRYDIYPPVGAKFQIPISGLNRSLFTTTAEWPEFLPHEAKLIHDHNVNAKWAEVSKKVREYLENFKTLNQAMNSWPGLKFYIPEKYLIRLERKVERKKAEPPPEITIDVDSLTAMAAINRMETQ
jgi:hypothetical protein